MNNFNNNLDSSISNIFKHSKQYPFHLSVAGVVIRNNKILLQYKKTTKVYRIPSESVEIDDTIFSVISRLGKEELGLKLIPLHFLGSNNKHAFIDNKGLKINKTTLYFLCKPLGKVQRTPLDIELELYDFVWIDIDQALNVLAQRDRREDRFVRVVLDGNTI